MPRDWIDADFKVVGHHYRPGEAHRDPKLRRWRFTGRTDAFGQPIWYRPPRLNRWQFFVALCAATFAAWLALAVVLDVAHHSGLFAMPTPA